MQLCRSHFIKTRQHKGWDPNFLCLVAIFCILCLPPSSVKSGNARSMIVACPNSFRTYGAMAPQHIVQRHAYTSAQVQKMASPGWGMKLWGHIICESVYLDSCKAHISDVHWSTHHCCMSGQFLTNDCGGQHFWILFERCGSVQF